MSTISHWLNLIVIERCYNDLQLSFSMDMIFLFLLKFLLKPCSTKIVSSKLHL